LMVMFYHLTIVAGPFAKSAFLHTSIVNLASMGWAGVDLFFVLSGFLITSILLKTRQEAHYFKNFYARRILRIFPLYYLFIAVMFIFLPIISPELSPVNAQAARASWPFFTLYLHNWIYIPKFSDRFSVLVPPFLAPTWSLAIEEQFYFLWPSVVFFLSRRKLFIVSIAIVVFTLLMRIALVQIAGSWASLEYFLYYSTLARFDGLCVGALIAMVFQSERWKLVISRFAWPVVIGVLIGMAGIVIANSDVFALSTNPYLDMWGYTLLALGSGAMVVLVTTGPSRGVLRVVFRNPILRFFGKYSYSMYILHIPVMYMVRREIKVLHFSGDAAWFACVVLSFGLTIVGALVTWHLLEKHAIGLKKYFEPRPAKSEG